jgi:hypothetical protein
MARYVRTEGDRRARRNYRARVGRWKCPGCGQAVSSLDGLSWHLGVEPDSKKACPAKRALWLGQTELP